MKPFKEPPNMTTIDLNSSAKIKNIDEDVKKTNNNYSCKIFIPVFLLVICIFTLLAVLILLLLSPFGIHQLPLTREKRALLVFQVPDHPNIESNSDGVSPTGIRTSQNKQKNLDVAEEVHSTQESVISHPCYIPPFLLTNFQHLQQQQQPQLQPQPQMQMQPQFQSFAATSNNYIPQPNYWGNPTNFYPASMSSPPLQPSYPSAPYFPCFSAPSSAGFPRSSIQEYEDLLTPEPLENLINCPISASGRCNNIVECREEEPNDETACSCREKAGVRVCDGYCDCPHCEDEEECFGCKKEEFACDDWSRFHPSSCIRRTKRCDGVRDCDLTGHDEDNCIALTNRIDEKWTVDVRVSYTMGFLMRMFEGRWYPVCSTHFLIDEWAAEICRQEAGPTHLNGKPKINYLTPPPSYKGAYLISDVTINSTQLGTCRMDHIVYVECPAIYCGLRYVKKNLYRSQEIDTSIEDILDQSKTASFGRINYNNNKDNIVGDGRVVGGRPSQPSAWPWLISIYKNGNFHCAGVIIAEQWILTAAHCVDRYWESYYEIQAGTLRRFSFSPSDQRRHARAIIKHELYDHAKLRNDISIIQLSAPLRFNKHVRPICLPTEITAGPQWLEGPAEGTFCTTVGWGAIAEHGIDPDHMREVQIPIMRSCSSPEEFDQDEICAGYPQGGKDACQGDSGGPLMCHNPLNAQQWYLAGIVSHGQGCARRGEPGVYTRVARYLHWISEGIYNTNYHQVINTLQTCPGYTCRVIRRCLSIRKRCDGIIDCFHGDDEEGCTGKVYPKDSGILGLIKNIPHNNNNTVTYRCNNNEIIMAKNRCDRIRDCEDGSDEYNCSCKEYLVSSNDSEYLCDGILDCVDGEDETVTNCRNKMIQCSNEQFSCKSPGVCLNSTQMCDNIINCPNGEDENDCLTLFPYSKNVELDKSGRPMVYRKGLVYYRSSSNKWKILCNSTIIQPLLAAQVCNSQDRLGYGKYRNYIVDSVEHSSPCLAFFVKCWNISSFNKLILRNRPQAPWLALIQIDGRFRCFGVLISTSYVLTSSDCLQNYLTDKLFITIRLGWSHIMINSAAIKGPFENVTLSRKVTTIKDSPLLILKLEADINITRYIEPIRYKMYENSRFKNCRSIIRNSANEVFWWREYPSSTVDLQDAKDAVIICESGNGWFLSSILTAPNITTDIQQYWLNIDNILSNNTANNLTSIIILEDDSCKGFRCSLGNCLNNSQICNSIQECHDGADEAAELCNFNKTISFSTRTELIEKCVYQCTNYTDKCIKDKKQLCDGYKNCPLGDDENICVKFKEKGVNAGEVLKMSYGHWTRGCFPGTFKIEELDIICEKLGFKSSQPYVINLLPIPESIKCFRLFLACI